MISLPVSSSWMTDGLLLVYFGFFPFFFFYVSVFYFLLECGPMVHVGLASKRQSRRAKFKEPGQSLIG